jgi:hypothetical protein
MVLEPGKHDQVRDAEGNQREGEGELLPVVTLQGPPELGQEGIRKRVQSSGAVY